MKKRLILAGVVVAGVAGFAAVSGVVSAESQVAPFNEGHRQGPKNVKVAPFNEGHRVNPQGIKVV